MQDVKVKRFWGDSVNGCRISISLPEVQIQTGQPVELSIVLANIGSAVIHSPRTSNWFDFEVSILAPDGKAVPMTEFGAKLHGNLQEQGGTLLDLKPGDELTSSVEVSRLYGVAQPGVYSITVSKMLMNPAGEYFRVVSNRVSIAVKEGKR